jgi:hypothetical protein
MMLRRWEMYSFSPDAPPAAVRGLADAFLRCGDFIPEVLDSAIGTNLSEAPVRLVWEHAYESTDAYKRYMVHPFHACILDRSLLADSPERIVSDNDLGAGLVGYSCDGPVYRLAQGVRRLVLLDLEPGSSTDEIEALIAKETAPRVSVFAENTFGAAWMDGITPITGRPPWSHLWEQGWDDLAAFEAWRDGTSPMAEVERAGWDGLARRAGSVHYKLITA